METKIDFSEIIANHINEQVQNGSLKDSITKRIDHVINEAVESATGYDFKRILSDQIKTQVCAIASELNFSEMLSAIFETQKQVIEEQAKQAILDKANKEIKAFFDNSPKEAVNLSTIIDKFKEYAIKSNRHLDRKRDEIKAELKKTFSKSLNLSLEYPDRESMHIYISEYEGVYTLSSIYLDDKDLSKTYTLSYTPDFRTYLIKLYLNKTPINIDITNDDIDTYLYFDEY